MAIPKVRLHKSARKQKDSEKDTVKQSAEAAVKHFEDQRYVLREMESQWQEDFPEALAARNDILEQQDIVQDAINKAKPLVAAARTTIGDFKCTLKFLQPHYDDDEVTRILSESTEGPSIVFQMLQDGVAKLSLDNKQIAVWAARNPKAERTIQPAWREKEPMKPAVSVPKL